MGYPMTWQRIVNRNALGKGDYSDPGEHSCRVNLGSKGGIATMEEFYETMGPHYVERLTQYEGRFKMLLGDIRRFEIDSLDESAVCSRITQMTGIDQDSVAAVLKSFLSV